MSGQVHLDHMETQGRVDVAAARALRQVALASENPLAQMLYKVLRPDLEKVLTKNLGPNTKNGKQAKKAAALKQAIQKRLQEEL